VTIELDTAEWHPARLIPVAGIRGQQEQEARATSAFLAVLSVVPAFAHSILAPFGAPRGVVETYSEVQFKDAQGKSLRPDGVIIVSRGARVWRALVEVKTGGAQLRDDQVDGYLDVARDHGFNCVITISNEIVAKPTDVPVTWDRRKTRKIGLFHVSWWRILTTAVIEQRHRGIADPEQAWILNELIAYLFHPKSGASGFEDMGSTWVSVRDAARAGTLRASDREAREVAHHWEQFLDYVGLGLSQQLGTEVAPVRSRKRSFSEIIDADVKTLASKGVLEGSIRVPGAVADIELVADLRARQVSTSVAVGAPQEGRAQTRVNWMLRQLPQAAPALRITTAFANTRETSSVMVDEARADLSKLLSAVDPRREIRSFEIALTRPLGLKNGKTQGSFIQETQQQVIDFYGEVVQDLSPWQARAPRLPEPREELTEPGEESPRIKPIEDSGSEEGSSETFAPGEFHPLADAQPLETPSFAPMQSGVRLDQDSEPRD
jgi:hypothetical protein